MGKKVSAFRDPATRIDDDDRRSAAPAAWHTEEDEKNSTAAAGRYEQRLIIIRVDKRCQCSLLQLQGFC